MYYGSCFSTKKEMVLCFGQNDSQQCRIGSDPTGEFTRIATSKFSHQGISLTASKGEGFLVIKLIIFFKSTDLYWVLN